MLPVSIMIINHYFAITERLDIKLDLKNEVSN